MERDALEALKASNLKSVDYTATSLKTHPVNGEADITTRCNANCQMCYWRASKVPPVDMPVEVFRSFMEATGDYLTTLVMSGPGDPLVHPRIREMCELMREHGVKLSLVTNGALLDGIMDILREIGGYVTVSIDSPDPDTYEEIRRGLKWDRVYSNLLELSALRIGTKENFPRVVINYCVMGNTVGGMREMVEIADKLDLLGVRFLYGNVKGFEAEKWGVLDPDDPRIVDAIAWARKEHPRLTIWDQCTSKTKLCLVQSEKNLCRRPWDSIVLNYDGGMYPCCKYVVPLAANQREETRRMGTMPMTAEAFMAEAWNGPTMRRMRQLVLDNPAEWPPDFAYECMNCLRFSGFRGKKA